MSSTRERDTKGPRLARPCANQRTRWEALDGILVVDENRQVASFNRRFLEIWKIDPAFAETADDRALIGAVGSLLTDPAAFLYRVTYLYQHPLETSRDDLVLTDGRCLDRYSAPLLGEGGELLGRIWFFRDTTDQRRAERDAAAFQQLAACRAEWTDAHASAWWATHRTSPRIAASAVPVEPSAAKLTVPPGGSKDTFVGIDWRTRTGDGR